MSTRLATGGRLIDRTTPRHFTFNGKRLTGYAGDTLASALLANDQMLVGRSFKYHRPRGIVASGAEEPNALVGLGRGDRFEPNQRATTTEVFDGLEATSQNHWPSLNFDIGTINARFASFLPAGFYYKTFTWPRSFWKHLYEPIIRKSAGLGRAPDPEARDPDSYEHFHAHVDVLIIGGGIAGMETAKRIGETGVRVLLIEQDVDWGGRAPVDGGEIGGQPPEDYIGGLLASLNAMDNVSLRTRCMGAGVYDHGYALAYERLADHTPAAKGPRHRLWRIRAAQIITATGALERPLAFAGNDLPGVMLASALRDYVVNWGVSPGDRTVIVTNNDDAYRSALVLRRAGLAVPAIVDARVLPQDSPLMAEARALGIRILQGHAIDHVMGQKRVTGVALCAHAGAGGAVIDEIACDAVAMSGGWSPVVHLWSHCGGKLRWDETRAMFRPDHNRPPTGDKGQAFVTATGAANGMFTLQEVLDDAVATAAQITKTPPMTSAAPQAHAQEEAPLAPVWMMPQGAGVHHRAKAWLDFQNDVKVSDVQLAAREGFESVEHAKRYTTLGMATDQGKLSNINGLAILSGALGADIPDVGTTTFRPPYTPISMGAIAGPGRGDTFQPIRRTPIHDWLAANGAEWEPVGQWRRPYCLKRPGETTHDAVTREVTNTRKNVGLLDASTLGKLIVKGPDAGRFLDMLYTNMMSTLKPGRCRYGLMCNENGFLMDDGVVARLDADTFLCHTTSGGADHIHAHMEDWLQCEWWDWQVYVANVTEQYGQIAVVGPNARKLLEAVGGLDVSRETLPFMGWVEGALGGIPVRIFRISFSGELSFEIAVKAGYARHLWDHLLRAGRDFGVMPYGTEALHIMRAEKGFIMIGDETDGTVIPQDLGLDWAISKKKTDYLGKRAQARPDMARPDRWKLVGLETCDGAVLPDGAYAVAEGRNANGQRNVFGRVTSTYYSPTLGRGIAMGLVQNGPDRLGEVIHFAKSDGVTTIEARVVDPVFYDKDGEKQNV
ncbi:sarcosine oxidase subunit alpha family protein [Marinovum sp. 2_MG-2023]|uniref:sarcosine oxidase subunit alpha family protein n=1 Tax=unclassified Marinovum TaxID=2647166 RepID=UPI0026E2488D|nr:MULTISPECIES: sarcosine oxidase subunit alpha family protein [unclassified Marinovum]MDO6731958.1 sarcosine oxidase subunit alpha family protein [Marinovum sp. 2_MG-2023]MDO6781210.1 sarcosine oxidase subunit alpha family protein [Marinovum sp. 1_MG-2023]